MTEAYSVAARLTLTSNAGQVVSDLIRQFERLDKVIGSTQGNVSRLAAELKTLSSGSRWIGATVKALEGLSKARMAPGLMADMERMTGMARQFATVQAELAAAARQTATAYREMSRSQPRGSGAAGAPSASRPSVRHGDLLNAGMGLGMAGDAGMGIFGKAIRAEMEVSEQLASLRMNTKLSDSDISAARAAAEKATRSIPGTTLAENLHHLTEAFTVTADLQEAMAGLEGVARFAYVSKNLPGAHRGDSSFAGMQAIEVMQRFYDSKTGHVSMDAFNQQLAAMSQVAVGTGGRVDGGAYLGFAKQSRVGGMVANDQYLYRDLPAMLISLGGNRAGTGDAALWSQFVTGKMTENAFGQLQSTGLIDKSATWEKGQVSNMMSHLRNPELFGANRIEWMRQEILGPNGALSRQGIDPNDRLKVAEFISKWSSRQTGLGFMSEGVIGMEGINKEAGKIGDTTRDPMKVLQQYDPMQKMREFQAAENALFVTLGKDAMGPALEGLKALTKVIQELADWGKAHPDAAKNLTLVGGGMAAMASGAGQLAMVLFVGAPIVTGLRSLAGALSPFAAGGSAATAIGTMSGAGAGSLMGVASGLTGLGAALVGVEYGLPRAMNALAGWLGVGNPDGSKGGGKGLQVPGSAVPSPNPNSTGNHFGDWLAEKWKEFRDAPGPGNGPKPRYQRSSYEGGGEQPPIVLHATSKIILDGREVASSLVKHMIPAANSGMTGFDIKAWNGRGTPTLT
ncbi:MAG: hypothetical protein ACRYGM_05260 [Janthinobacterium lividum]